MAMASIFAWIDESGPILSTSVSGLMTCNTAEENASISTKNIMLVIGLTESVMAKDNFLCEKGSAMLVDFLKTSKKVKELCICRIILSMKAFGSKIRSMALESK